jgi:hypothetical protein
MTSALLVLSDDDYAGVAELLQVSGGKPFLMVLSDGSFFSFGEHFAETIEVKEGQEAIEVSGAKLLTISGAVRIIPVPSEKKEAKDE